MSEQEKEQFKLDTVKDPKFWFGFLGMILSTMALYGKLSAGQARIEEKLSNLEGIRDRVIRTEGRVDAVEQRVNSMEKKGIGSVRELYRTQP